MNKEREFTVFSRYEEAPIFGSAALTADNYAFVSKPKASRRTYGNLEIIQLHSGGADAEYKVYHGQSRISLDYDTAYRHLMRHVHYELNRQNCREGLWQRAVKNLYKRINFLQLNIEFLQDDINEDEFEQTLTTHEDEYVISFKDVQDTQEAEAIHDIVLALGRSFDVHEVAELFGVEPESLHTMQAQASKQKAAKPSARLTSGR